jgi:hypothetical protein
MMAIHGLLCGGFPAASEMDFSMQSCPFFSLSSEGYF